MTIFIPKKMSALVKFTEEGSRYMLHAVRVDTLDSGLVRLEATNGKILAILHFPSAAPTGPDAKRTFDSLESAENGASTAFISGPDFTRALKLGGKVDRVGLVLGTGGARIAGGSETLTVEQVTGRWPDTKNVMPTQIPVCKVKLDPDLLIRICQLAKALEMEKLEFFLYDLKGNKPVGIIGIKDALTLDALIMPKV